MPIQTRDSNVTTLVEGIRIARNASRPKRYGRDAGVAPLGLVVALDDKDFSPLATDYPLACTKVPTAMNAAR